MKTLITSIALLFASAAFAQSLGEIRGSIIDPFGDPLPAAHVTTTVASQELGTTTEVDGKFILKPLPPGLYGVTITYIGFQTRTISGVEVTADRATYLNNEELSFMGALDTLIIVGEKYRRPLIKIDDPSRMSLLAEEFKNDPNKRDPMKMIANSFAGVTPAPNGDGLYFRGSRTENMISFIDGVKISGSVPRVPPSAISSISVYTGGLPAKYGDVTGGVIVIETKTYSEMFQAARVEDLKLEQARKKN